MIFNNFEIIAIPHLAKGYCTTKNCGKSLHEVSNGWFSHALFCFECKSVYVPKLVKLPKKQVTKEFVKQAEDELRKRYKKFRDEDGKAQENKT